MPAVDEPDADPESVARSICLSQLDRAPRTRGQLAEVLRRRDVSDEAAEQVLSRLVEVGLVDDEAFALAWVESRHRSKGMSRTALARELRTRGVDDEVIATAVDQLDTDDELVAARDLVRRRQRSMGAVDAATQQRRLVALLGRKGYSAGLAFRVVREILLESRLEETDAAAPADYDTD